MANGIFISYNHNTLLGFVTPKLQRLSDVVGSQAIGLP